MLEDRDLDDFFMVIISFKQKDFIEIFPSGKIKQIIALSCHIFSKLSKRAPCVSVLYRDYYTHFDNSMPNLQFNAGTCIILPLGFFSPE